MGRFQQRRLIAAIVLAAIITYAILTFTYQQNISAEQPLSTHSTVQEVDNSTAPAHESLSKFTNQPSLTLSAVLPATASSSELPTTTSQPCLHYEQQQKLRQGPFSAGWRQFPVARPPPECRTFTLPSLENLIEQMKGLIRDPDLFRLFENSYPNTLDTTIKWRGYASAVDPVTQNEVATDEELAFVITGDIDAMWLRDSASQIYSYLPLLQPSSDPDSLASLWRGVINLHARYITISPYCHSFQPPPESSLPPTTNGAFHNNRPLPPYDPQKVFDCKWELDSIASFLQISVAYYERTNDLQFFEKYSWVSAVSAAISAAAAMRLGTYAADGKVEKSAWSFTGWTNRGTETLSNDGLGNPTRENGMVRSAFRPSDDACIYQLLVPSNMMWAKYLEEASLIMERLKGEQAKKLTFEMRNFSIGIRRAIDNDAIVNHKEFGDIWAYEIDGYGGVNLMDDANVPSLLSIPLFNYTQSSLSLPASGPINYSQIYMNTRRFVLSDRNPYFMRGPVISAIGGPHLGPGKPWPMAAIIRALTALSSLSTNDMFPMEPRLGIRADVVEEVTDQLLMVLNSTSGSGVIHESVNAWNEGDWTRSWFGWANGLFGELILKLAEDDKTEKNKITKWLDKSWQ